MRGPLVEAEGEGEGGVVFVVGGLVDVVVDFENGACVLVALAGGAIVTRLAAWGGDTGGVDGDSRGIGEPLPEEVVEGGLVVVEGLGELVVVCGVAKGVFGSMGAGGLGVQRGEEGR